jgi:Pvc16 N-terminal domain
MMLILNALECVRQRLNSALHNANPRNDEWVVLSNVLDQKGQEVPEATDKIVMFLANITHETIQSTYTSAIPSGGSRYAIVSPPLYINLYVLFYANLAYKVALSTISATISFFQQMPTFTRDSLPGLDPQIDKLSFEFTNLDITELNYVMGLLGTKYLPSVYYKVRLLPFQGDAVMGQVPAAQGSKNDR